MTEYFVVVTVLLGFLKYGLRSVGLQGDTRLSDCIERFGPQDLSLRSLTWREDRMRGRNDPFDWRERYIQMQDE